MRGVDYIGFEANHFLTWHGITEAIAEGHRHPKAVVDDTFLKRGEDTLMVRAAMIDGLGSAVKVATVFPGNPQRDLPMVNGAVSLFNDRTGQLEAMVDFNLVTRWKTAGDSLLAATLLAPPEVRTILVVGAGAVSESMVFAYRSVWPKARFLIWNRTRAKAEDLAETHRMSVADDLADAVAEADIITTATMAPEPLIRGDWLRPGQHVDLIGAFRADLREADDVAMQRARIFVDSYATTLDHIGELKIPLAAGTITREDVIADYYDLAAFSRDPDDITLFKNGGGAHLDLMVARAILDTVRRRGG
ncbi:MAG: ornithine cyclodeaminase [Rhodobacteraceae bacterium]|nr:ornithine cyclodeaminase [Paracoccaceae bacterium]